MVGHAFPLRKRPSRLEEPILNVYAVHESAASAGDLDNFASRAAAEIEHALAGQLVPQLCSEEAFHLRGRSGTFNMRVTGPADNFGPHRERLKHSKPEPPAQL
jgi:hypothetical protein